jgi:hypothetical protein
MIEPQLLGWNLFKKAGSWIKMRSFLESLHLNTQLRIIRNFLCLCYNISRLLWGVKVEQDINPILR